MVHNSLRAGVMIFLISYAGMLQAQSADSVFLKVAYERLQRAMAYTGEIARLMPADDYGFKPSPEEKSFAEQVLHIAHNVGWLSGAYLSNGQPNPVGEADLKVTRKEDVIAVLDKAFAHARRALEHFPAGALLDRVDFFAGEMNQLQIINLLNDHHTHHRGQLIVYLRLKGLKPPRYVGW
jgi:uncharacterized damage-inducible protein DinB